jgi:hypothetical protein
MVLEYGSSGMLISYQQFRLSQQQVKIKDNPSIPTEYFHPGDIFRYNDELSGFLLPIHLFQPGIQPHGQKILTNSKSIWTFAAKTTK